MNKLMAIVLCIADAIMAFAGDNGYKVTYDGGFPFLTLSGHGDEVDHRLQPSPAREG